ncbi:MAG: DinB family protein [Armatimonadota bacterium]|nr:DinB family protein [Armatimonadota bacterium]MDR7520009.1 DinB family protein [Armatimonadota bacterium]MDR7549228.1 DinB family protein [Armatimonadota bacterium]
MLTTHEITALVRAYADGPRLMESALAGVSDDELRFKPGPEHWSIHENVAHVAEIDLIVAARIRFVLAMPGAPLLATDAAGWAKAFDYSTVPLQKALALMRAVRETTADLLYRAPAGAWEHVGIHSKHGPQTLEWIVKHMVEHVEYHLKTIAKRREQYAESRRASATEPPPGQAIS